MRDRTEFSRSRGSRGIVFLLICFAVLLAIAARAQKTESKTPGPPKYDLQTETKVKGTIEEVKMPPKGGEKEIVHLMVKVGPDTLDVYLSPKSFLDDMAMDFSKGDEISLTGSKVKVGEADLILAREVVKGNNTFTLRDDKGGPVWNWHR
jgi:predicted PhzF superfamily epimerase YddE/YHI9